MLRRVLLDDEIWLITVGLLGGVTVYYKPEGRVRTVHSGERRHLYDIVDALRRSGVSLDHDSEPFAAALREFGERVLLRGDAAWRRYFIDRPARQIAADILAAAPALPKPVRRQVPGGLGPRLWRRLCLSATPANLRLLLPLRNRVR